LIRPKAKSDPVVFIATGKIFVANGHAFRSSVKKLSNPNVLNVKLSRPHVESEILVPILLTGVWRNRPLGHAED
jgi:hypothetical protein